MCVTLDAILKFQFLPVMSSAPSSAERHLSGRCKQVLEGESTHPFLRRSDLTNKRQRFYVLHLNIHEFDFCRDFLFIKKNGGWGSICLQIIFLSGSILSLQIMVCQKTAGAESKRNLDQCWTSDGPVWCIAAWWYPPLPRPSTIYQCHLIKVHPPRLGDLSPGMV